MRTLPQPRTAAMEATVFTGWVSDYRQSHDAAGRCRGHTVIETAQLD
jgi:hypothetical protein